MDTRLIRSQYTLQSIGYKGILLYGTPEQKQKYLSDLATGRKFAAYCLTEPGSGSDANSISTGAEKDESGHYRISGGKIWKTIVKSAKDAVQGIKKSQLEEIK